MAYATQADIVTLYSENALFVADRDGDGVPDAAAITRALGSASGEIDSFLNVRYQVPIEAPSDLLMQFCVDIALYRLALGREVLTEEHRKRYEDALAHLKLIAAGKAALVLPVPEGAEEAEQTGPRPIVSGGPEREFTREKMRGL